MVLGIITVAVILFGFRYRQANQKELINKSNYETINQTESFEARQKKKEEEKRAKFLAAFDEKRENNTVADFLQYVKYAKGDTNVAFYGEIEDKAQWAVDNMTQLATERAFTEMKTSFVSTLENETISERVEDLIALNPDVVFFHTPMPVEGVVRWDEEGSPIEQDNINEVLAAYSEMKDALPEALIVLVTPAPKEVDPDKEEEISWHQVEIDSLVSQSESYAIPVFNIHNQVMDHLTTNTLEIASLYNEEGAFTPEAAETLKTMFAENLKTLEIDTTTAYILDGKPAEVDIVIEVYEEAEEITEEESINEVVEEEWTQEETEVDEWINESEEEDAYVPPVQNVTPPASSRPPAVGESRPQSAPSTPRPQPTQPRPPAPEPKPEPKPEPEPEPKPEPIPEQPSEVIESGEPEEPGWDEVESE